jgi:hypothetical protein
VARDPTPEEWAAEVQEAQEAHMQLVAAVLVGRAAMWAEAEACWRLNECRGWLKLGYDTKNEYLAQPEIYMSQWTFNQNVRAWGGTVELREIPLEDLREIDVTKVDIVLPEVTRSKVSIEDALADAKELGAHDLRKKYRGIESPADPPPPGEDDDGPEDEDDATVAMTKDQAREDMVEARDSGAAYPRVHHDAIVWAVRAFDRWAETENEDGQRE